MLSFISAVQAALPYMLMVWLTPFVVIAIKMARGTKAAETDEFPYIKNRDPFSPAERSLFRLLEQAAGDKYCILAKVQAPEIINVRLLSNQGAWNRALEQLNCRTFDFVLCDKDYLSVACAIKLEPAAGSSEEAAERDTFLEGVCNAIALPLIHVVAPTDLSAVALRQKIRAALAVEALPDTEPSEKPFTAGLPGDTAGERPWSLGEAQLAEENAQRFHIRRSL